MFTLLLAITLALPLVLSLFVASWVVEPAAEMFSRVLGHADGRPWARVLQIVLVLGGTVGGVPIYDLERIAGLSDARSAPLTGTRWTMTIYESVLGSAEALGSALMLVLCVAMIAYGLRRRRQNRDAETDDALLAALAADSQPLPADGA